MCLSCWSWYGHRLAPYVVHLGCQSKAFEEMRKRIIPKAEGVVVEVGFGSGLNLHHYNTKKVKRLVGIDPDPAMLALAKPAIRFLHLYVECIQAGGENMPLADHCADTVVVTYALCTIPDPAAALREIRRILKSSGRLIFIEHGEADQRFRRKWQHWLSRPWGWLAAGCHLTRNPMSLIREAGFSVLEEEHTRFPLSFWQLGNHYAGIAIAK